jgi:hypothetical protein
MVCTFHAQGTLTADLNFRVAMPYDCQLEEVSAVSGNTAAAGVEVGSTSDADAYMVKKSSGVSAKPESLGKADFVGADWGSG